LGLIRKLENGEIAWIDPHKTLWPEKDVLRWLVTFLESLANWKPGTPPPSLLFGVPEYLRDLRFSQIELKGPARAGAGRPEKHDWEEGLLFAQQLLRDRGDPKERRNSVKDWNSRADLARAVETHMDSEARKTGEEGPSNSTVRKKLTEWFNGRLLKND
jgi:hypothetical protein